MMYPYYYVISPANFVHVRCVALLFVFTVSGRRNKFGTMFPFFRMDFALTLFALRAALR